MDSGAIGNFIDLGLLSLANFPLKRLPQPIGAFNIDGTPNRRGTILWKAHTHIVLPHESDDLDLMVVSLGRKQIVTLGSGRDRRRLKDGEGTKDP